MAMACKDMTSTIRHSTNERQRIMHGILARTCGCVRLPPWARGRAGRGGPARPPRPGIRDPGSGIRPHPAPLDLSAAASPRLEQRGNCLLLGGLDALPGAYHGGIGARHAHGAGHPRCLARVCRPSPFSLDRAGHDRNRHRRPVARPKSPTAWLDGPHRRRRRRSARPGAALADAPFRRGRSGGRCAGRCWHRHLGRPARQRSSATGLAPNRL